MEIQENTSWQDVKRTVFHPALKESLSVDVVIIGAGLAGVLTAYKLAKEGKSVVVLEKKAIGSGVTSLTTAFLTHDIDTDLTDLEKMFGSDKAKMVWRSHADGINEIERIVNLEKIECEFKRCSAFVYTIKEDGIESLKQEVDAATKLGFDSQLHSNNPFKFKNYGLMETKNQAKFHPLKFLFQLADVCKTLGVQFFENTEALKYEFKDGEWRVNTKEDFLVSGRDLVLATYYPLDNPTQTLFKKGMYVSYVLEVQIPQGVIPENIYWDDDNPYNYFRIENIDERFDRMIIGGQDHRKEIKMDEDRNFNALNDYLKNILGDISYTIVKRWTGPILEPSDGLALIGETYDHQYVATAFSGNGMTYSAITCMLVPDLILGKQSSYSEIYDPKRIPSLYQIYKKGRDYVGEFFGGAGENIFKSKNPDDSAMPV